MVISRFIHPKEVFATDRSKEYFTILTFLHTTRVKTIHHISKTIFCFAGLWFDADELGFGLGVHDVLKVFKESFINPHKGILVEI